MTQRVGATHLSRVPKDVLQQLNQGIIQTVNLQEALAIDFALLLTNVEPKLKKKAGQLNASMGITKRMALAAELLYELHGARAYQPLSQHSSDIVRSWAAYILAKVPNLSLRERLKKIRCLADDPHFGVREWAWLSIREYLIAQLPLAISLFERWVQDDSPFIRRFAIESIRPRGVWCKHIDALKKNPAQAIHLLNPLRTDQEKYVQDSVANWLNDAAKTHPGWVQELCADWLKNSPQPSTQRICRSAQRSIRT